MKHKYSAKIKYAHDLRVVASIVAYLEGNEFDYLPESLWYLVDGVRMDILNGAEMFSSNDTDEWVGLAKAMRCFADEIEKRCRDAFHSEYDGSGEFVAIDWDKEFDVDR